MPEILHMMVFAMLLGAPCVAMLAVYGMGYGLSMGCRDMGIIVLVVVGTAFLLGVVFRVMAVALLAELLAGVLLGRAGRRKRIAMITRGVSDTELEDRQISQFLMTLPVPVAIMLFSIYMAGHADLLP